MNDISIVGSNHSFNQQYQTAVFARLEECWLPKPQLLMFLSLSIKWEKANKSFTGSKMFSQRVSVLEIVPAWVEDLQGYFLKSNSRSNLNNKTPSGEQLEKSWNDEIRKGGRIYAEVFEKWISSVSTEQEHR